jgi:hypothetical protein
MSSKEDGDATKVVSFRPRATPVSAHVKLPDDLKLADLARTAEGLLLIRAFLKIASPDDRKEVIDLAERLSAEPKP